EVIPRERQLKSPLVNEEKSEELNLRNYASTRANDNDKLRGQPCSQNYGRLKLWHIIRL
ncbi:hypothetical protein ACJMK2_030892, partial [Sinanodonta woodiana]